LAVREVLVNAIAHAAYFQTGMRIMVAIDDDRLVIHNPGSLPFGLTIKELKICVSKIRNRMIARIMGMLKMMEEWCSGYQRIREACNVEGSLYVCCCRAWFYALWFSNGKVSGACRLSRGSGRWL